MASVFLSYDRDDAAKARVIANALEKAGHSVWWDRHIQGGSQYSREIEQALKAADAVVVLWSAQSVESAWVRDEAAVGRDSGRLVPVRIDDTDVPLGFRQYQNIDLGKWKGRGTPPRLKSVLSAIDALAGRQTEQAKGPASALAASRPAWMLGLGLVALLAAAAAFFLIQRGTRSDAHTIAVTAADPAARPLARDLLANLGSLQSAQSGPLRLVGDNQGRPDLILEATTGSVPGQVGAGLILKAGGDGGILWSRDFAQASGSQADLKQQMALTSWRAIDCAIEGLEADGRPLDQQMLKLYLGGCAKYPEGANEDVQSIVPQLREVVAKAPSFRAGWATLLLAEGDVASAAIEIGGSDVAPLQDRLSDDIGKARALDPAMAEATIAEAAILARNAHLERLRLLDAAKARNPEHPAVLEARAKALMKVGRLRAAIDDSKRAAELAPWSPRALSAYVLTLAFAGRTDAALAELQRAERLWPETPVVRDAQYNFHWHFGDPMVALKLTPPGLPKGREMFLRARAEPTAANIDRFVAFIHAMYERLGRTDISPPIVQEFAAFGREDELFERILSPRNTRVDRLSANFFEPPLKAFRQDPRFMLAAQKAGLVDYWLKTDKWPDFCFEEEPPYDCKAEAAKAARTGRQ